MKNKFPIDKIYHNLDPKQRELFTTKQSRLKFNDDMNRFMKITTPGFKG